MITVDETERASIKGIIDDIMFRHRAGSLTDPRGRGAVAAFVTSYAPLDYLNESDATALNIYVDVTLQMNKLSRQTEDPCVVHRVNTIIQVALGDEDVLPAIRRLH